MKIAHLSDLHVIALDAVGPLQLLNKRLTGYVNLRLRRAAAHQVALARAVLAEVRRRELDHVVVTGDLVYLAVEQEFRRARALLDIELGLGSAQISLVPGNHDAYTRGAFRQRLFERHFAPHLTTELPDAAGQPSSGVFPYVRLRGSVAIIGLSSAVPRPPWVASGTLGAVQRAALHGVLAHAEVRRRMPVLLVHHPLHRPRLGAKRWLEGLTDGAELAALLGDLPRGLLLHGHLHRRVRHTLRTARGHVDALGTTSASLTDGHADRAAGFNVYELDDDDGALLDVAAYRHDPTTGAFQPTPVPRGTLSAPGPSRA